MEAAILRCPECRECHRPPLRIARYCTAENAGRYRCMAAEAVGS